MKLESITPRPKRVTSSPRRAKRIREGCCTFVLIFAVVFTLAVLAPAPAHAQKFTLLYTFVGAPTDGAGPSAGLVMDVQGNLYGTTYDGGVFSAGAVFKVTKAGKESLLHSFTVRTRDGSLPYAGLVMDVKGDLYGTTTVGGLTDGNCAIGCGTVFRLTETGKESVLYRFKGGTKDGYSPNSALIVDAKGNLFGTTGAGGASAAGTVFKVDTFGKETVLYSFKGGRTDGAVPWSALVMDSKGNLYGTTQIGGAGDLGTVFKISNSGKETVLLSFNGSPDGEMPLAGLVMDAHGNLYGNAPYGGNFSCGVDGFGCGTVFKLTQTGNKTVLYTFAGGPADGRVPWGGLILDAKGNLYGTTLRGGLSDAGTIFKVDSRRKETVLYSFTGGVDGGGPNGDLVLDTKGNLYGTTGGGGANGAGTVFKLTP
jgi:uncharacterized repeat protein (TIGR03803 family)